MGVNHTDVVSMIPLVYFQGFKGGGLQGLSYPNGRNKKKTDSPMVVSDISVDFLIVVLVASSFFKNSFSSGLKCKYSCLLLGRF